MLEGSTPLGGIAAGLTVRGHLTADALGIVLGSEAPNRFEMELET